MSQSYQVQHGFRFGGAGSLHGCVQHMGVNACQPATAKFAFKASSHQPLRKVVPRRGSVKPTTAVDEDAPARTSNGTIASELRDISPM